MLLRSLPFLLAAPLVLGGCGQVGASGDAVDKRLEGSGGGTTTVGQTSDPGLLQAIKSAPFLVPYRGIRRVTMSYPEAQPVDYREEVGPTG